MTPYWLLLATAIAASIVGNTLLKLGAGAPDLRAQALDWRSLLGLAIYAAGALLYMVALRRIPVSVALPFTAVSYVAATAVGYYGFHEPVSAQQLAALGLILVGVALLATA